MSQLVEDFRGGSLDRLTSDNRRYRDNGRDLAFDMRANAAERKYWRDAEKWV